MKQKIRSMEVWVNRQRGGRKELLPSGSRETETGVVSCFGDEKTGAEVTVEERDGILTGEIRLWLETQPFRENDNLSADVPVELVFGMEEQPKRMTAMYLHRDWWTRPVFLTETAGIPARTQALYMEQEEGYSFLLPLAGEVMKTTLKGEEGNRLVLQMTAHKGGFCEVCEKVFMLAEADSIYQAVSKVFGQAAREKSLPLKEEKEYPAMLEYLGWCSWDAFYTDITEEKVREKAEELQQKDIPVRWMLLDDGWLSVHGQRLYSLQPEEEKFPKGFKRMTEDIKDRTSVRWFGVWHALGGYWGGIEPGSPAAVCEREHLYETAEGKLLPHPSAEKGFGFFRDWYESLRRDGIDFVKVDGQSAVKNYFENEFSVCRAARGCHQALEGAAASYMGGRLINCMGMAMENLLGRPGSAVSRNSDDFVPEAEDGFREHLLQNAYNAVYHDEMYFCDWDMFWTCHEDATKHGILRALSGGPVYVSDKTGESSREAVLPLVYHDGRILRMDRTGKPTPDCMFPDPSKGGVLKVCNIASCGSRKGGAVAVYNVSSRPAEGCVCSSDIYDLPSGAYYIYDYMAKSGEVAECREFRLEAGACGLYLFIPVEKGFAPVGLADKYISFHAVRDTWATDSQAMAVLEEGGEFVFYREKNVEKITVNGEDCTSMLTREGSLYRIRIARTEKLIVMVE